MFSSTIAWIKEDYATHPVRFVLELLAWFMSIGCTIWMGYTLPTPPLYTCIHCLLYNVQFLRGRLGHVEVLV